MSRDLYDVIRKAQAEFPSLYPLLPITTLLSDDIEEVIMGLSQAAYECVQRAVSNANGYVFCEECGNSLEIDPAYCEYCYQENGKG